MPELTMNNINPNQNLVKSRMKSKLAMVSTFDMEMISNN